MRARSHLVAGFDPDDHTRARRILKQVKMNLVPQLTEGLVYTINKDDDPPFKWLGTCDVDADCLTSQAAAERSKEEHTKAELAREMLLDYLGDGAEVEKSFLQRKARELGISEVTLWRVATSLKVQTRAEGFGKDKKSYWLLTKTPKTGTRTQ